MADGSDLNAACVAAFHDAALAAWDGDDSAPAARYDEGAWHWIERNHVCNTLLWREESRARGTDLSDAEIAGCKRNIDRHNHARHEAFRLLDVSLLDLFGDRGAHPGARLHSETPGAMVDRLSLLALEICHARRGADPIVARLDPGFKRLAAQRRDLCDCLDRLLRELADGQACFHLYEPTHIPAWPCR